MLLEWILLKMLTISFDVHSGTVVEHAVVVGWEDVNGGVEPRGEDDEPEKEADDADDQASQTQVDAKATFAQHFRHPVFLFDWITKVNFENLFFSNKLCF